MPHQAHPTLNVALLHPVLDALKRNGCSDSELSRQLGLPAEFLYDPSKSLPANQVYGFLAWSSFTVGDPTFCAKLGQFMATGGWAPALPLLDAIYLRRIAGRGRRDLG